MGMLVLSRKLGEKITITHPDLKTEIVITIVGYEHGRTRLGFEAERTVAIWRNELLTKDPTDTALGDQS